MKKIYLCEAELKDEECPYYTFFVKEDNIETAEMLARDIAENDYDNFREVSVYEIKEISDLNKFCILKVIK